MLYNLDFCIESSHSCSLVTKYTYFHSKALIRAASNYIRKKFFILFLALFFSGSPADSGSGITWKIGSGSGLGINHTDSQHREIGSVTRLGINHTDSQQSETVQLLYPVKSDTCKKV
jgi:hypothetical protein